MQKLLSLEEFAGAADEAGLTFGRYALWQQARELETEEDALLSEMKNRVEIMREAVRIGLTGQKSRGGLSGGAARKLAGLRKNGQYKDITGSVLSDAIEFALAASEANASMGKILAAPTAGASGVLPGVFFALERHLELDNGLLAQGLAAAGLIGMVIASRASLAGAMGGCQAECGSAAAMAAGAAVDMAGGSPCAVAHASALAMKGLLGLVCDPVAGLVEVPCVKRNAMSAAVALTAAQMALAGIESFIPADEVFDAMKSVGQCMSQSLKETSDGGLAATPTATRWAEDFLRG